MSTASSVNMRSILGVLMVLAVSANDRRPIKGLTGKSVLLPCNCSGINQFKEFKWQWNSDGHAVTVINKIKTDRRYKGRAKLVGNDRDNCSLFLSNLNTKDTGEYRCIFHKGQQYSTIPMDLEVTGNAARPNPEGLSASCIRFFKIIPIVLLVGFCLVCGAIVRE